ncbi:MAG: UDP-N-acetylglucosamine 2-epimerase [Armatimonadetes bacterium]|nr:UDP-N-acetylglucosamine 2-epimerase [Armatimonadota bacterium]
MSSPISATSIVGARPNFVKVAPVARALAASGSFAHAIVHTGQHYEADMSERFFADLEIPPPDVHLGVGSGSHGEQTARMLAGVEGVLLARRPDVVLVYGDVNSTLAGALAAAKLGIPVCHVEAGLRSRDRTMPEELNRILVDQLSEILFTHSREAEANLAAEGIPRERIRFVGNVMIDSLARCRDRAEAMERAVFEARRVLEEDGRSASEVPR